jgi:hypothetical protein
MRIRAFIAVGIIAIVLFAYFAASHWQPRHVVAAAMSNGALRLNIPKEGAYWDARVREVGAAQARMELLSDAAVLPYGLQHAMGHILGESIYKANGLSQPLPCLDELGGGCLHGFLGRAIATEGLAAVVVKLPILCKESAEMPCEHGLGHGIVGYLGYTLDDLRQALAACKFVPNTSSLPQGCAGGAIMEYNLRTLSDGGPRPVDTHDPFHPCDEISTPYLRACLFLQATWWYSEFASLDINAASAAIGNYCASSPFKDAESMRACFGGIGYILPLRLSYAPEPVARACAAVSDDPDARIDCWSFAGPQLPSGSAVKGNPLVCGGLSGTASEKCSDALASLPNPFTKGLFSD